VEASLGDKDDLAWLEIDHLLHLNIVVILTDDWLACSQIELKAGCSGMALT